MAGHLLCLSRDLKELPIQLPIQLLYRVLSQKMTSDSRAIRPRPRRPKGPLVASINPPSRCYTATALKASGRAELTVGSSLRGKQSKAKRQQEQGKFSRPAAAMLHLVRPVHRCVDGVFSLAKEFDSSKVNSPFLDSRIVERRLRRADGT